MAKTKVLFGLLTFITIGMIIGALLQLIFIRRLEESSGIPHWVNDNDADDLRLGWVRPEIISWSPRIIVLHNFLSMEECDYLRAIAQPRLQVSTVVDIKTGKGIKSDVRTSSGMFLSSEERKYPLVKAIEKRISVFSQIPVENGELIQVLRYEKNQFYRPHHDYFADTFNLKRGGQRIATMLMYLSDNVVGGETYFPMAGDGECSCGGKMVKGMCVKPTKGDAVLFWSMASNLVDRIVQVGSSSQHQRPWLGSANEHSGSLNSGLLLYRMPAQEESPIPWSCHASPQKKCIATYCRLYDRLICFQGLDGATDQYSIHGGCEVLEGEKWSATKWMRQRTTI